MLNSNEKARLAQLIEAARMEIGGVDSYSISLGDIYWLALQLQRADVELTKIAEGKSTSNIDRIVIKQAKELLMSKYQLTENEAFRLMHKRSMDERITKFKVAKMILDSELKDA